MRAMPEVHLPHIDDDADDDDDVSAIRPAADKAKGKSIVKIALEVVLISAGVFLAARSVLEIVRASARSTRNRRTAGKKLLDRLKMFACVAEVRIEPERAREVVLRCPQIPLRR